MRKRLWAGFPKWLDVLSNVILPVAAGGVIYRCLSGRGGMEKLIRNYLPDGLWAYALLSCVLIIWNRKVHRVWVLISALSAVLFEYGQYTGVLAGTGDWLDVAVYLVFFGLALLSNQYIKNIHNS
jgi:hypothetical protein